VLDKLKIFLEELKQFRADVKAIASNTIGQKKLLTRAESLGSRWCNDIVPQLNASNGFPALMLDRYTTQLSRLLVLSSPSNRKSSYVRVLDAVLKNFRKDLILPVQQAKVSLTSSASSFNAFLAKIAPNDEGEYFKEALSCAKQGYFRAATVMGWCAAIDRLHRKIEEIGFAKFNVTSAQMASQGSGRFKRFNQTQTVNSLSELREVFDNIVLWIVEGMGLIDSNQHTRLRSCFEMRCQSAHPGEAPTTEYNLLSFFSDINEIVLVNPQFEVKRQGLAAPVK
jgi:hypothetical protein